MGILIDEDIAHIECVMRPSLCGFEDGPILPAEYWRKRLHRLLDSCHLTKAQLCSIDSLLLQLDPIDAGEPDDRIGSRRTASGSKPKSVLAGPDAHVVKSAGAKMRRPRVPVGAIGTRSRRPRPGTRTGLPDAMVAGNSANRQRRVKLSSPADEEDRWDPSASLAAAVRELMVNGLAATLNAVSAGHVLLGVHAMRLMQISGFEVWRNGMTQQPQTMRFDTPSAP